jgi:hypothetical protein
MKQTLIMIGIIAAYLAVMGVVMLTYGILITR